MDSLEGELRNVDQSFDAWLEFHKRAEIHDFRDGACYFAGDWVFRRHVRPRVLEQVAVSEADLVSVGIDLLNSYFDFLADGKYVARMFHAVPAHLADMDQTID